MGFIAAGLFLWWWITRQRHKQVMRELRTIRYDVQTLTMLSEEEAMAKAAKLQQQYPDAEITVQPRIINPWWNQP